MTLADLILVLLLERGPLSARAIAQELHRRYEDVCRVLHSDPRFVQTGKRRASRFHVVEVPSLDVHEAALRWHCSPETAEEILFGEDGFVERGYVANLNGNGRVVVTERGLEYAALVEWLA